MSPDKMVHMANQIAVFFKSQPGDQAKGVASHINDFWGPDMRAALLSYIDAQGEGLDPLVRDAAKDIAPPNQALT